MKIGELWVDSDWYYPVLIKEIDSGRYELTFPDSWRTWEHLSDHPWLFDGKENPFALYQFEFNNFTDDEILAMSSEDRHDESLDSHRLIHWGSGNIIEPGRVVIWETKPGV